MAIEKQINKLLSQEMDRRSFLKYSASFMLAVVGVTKLLDVILTSSHSGNKTISSNNQEQSTGYGSSVYGS